ncbi:VOC family protein [Paracoccus suum]|uniref:VOC family protein n=1 Tax=Paracoccus suum TaxID=2259340 RepID=A0A344PNR4_9RHOB|nr:VOC family protein [Paracoccus suum]AXC51019.1 VOC family protein [Paracoccus suum]
MAWKPDGYPEVSPYLIVSDAERTLAFLERAFGATRLRVMPRQGGKGLMHAEARIGSGVVMMGEMPEAVPSHVHIYVPDVLAAYERALAAGGEVVKPPTQDDEGDLRGGVADGNGTTWWISTQTRD